ncbi:hypothetical protein DWW67_03135 [Coprobacillus sp. AF16-47]|jgi:hypothetical protein|nr:hypothetical protein DWW67_03135 [Coprobacillus sp. AF16-47]DAK89182.1 MAG TPA: tail assembly chaperone [Caudoviricetes sp.]DAY68368.1 MAG TPA: tail assembly chaperone [Caudoviricetes sp.]
MELIINENVYNFRFGIGFVRYLDGKASVKQDGVTFGIGLETLLPNLLSKNTVTLVDCLIAANRTEKITVTQDILDKYIDDDSTDIDQVFEDVIEELKKSNASKLKTAKIIEDIKKNEELLELQRKQLMNQ